jgi:hypothetical protein
MHNVIERSTATTSDQTTDADLASLAASGDEHAFEAIMRRHNRLLFRTARSVLRNDAIAPGTTTFCRLAVHACRARCLRFARVFPGSTGRRFIRFFRMNL